jgi:hypothetical protein
MSTNILTAESQFSLNINQEIPIKTVNRLGEGRKWATLQKII